MKKSVLLSLLALILLSGCYVQRIKVDPTIKWNAPRGEPDVTKWEHFFIFGLVPNVEHNAVKDCKNEGGVAFVETRLTFFNQFVSFITFSLYSPSTTQVYCVDSQKND